LTGFKQDEKYAIVQNVVLNTQQKKWRTTFTENFPEEAGR
jgi:hypothetical protein